MITASASTAPGQPRNTLAHTRVWEEDPSLGFVRIFFYVNGFEPDDGGLKVVPGSHLFRDRIGRMDSDEALQEQWLRGKNHPITDDPLQIHALSAPPGTVIAMWTFAAHGVNPRQPSSDTRWCVVYAYRNPGLPVKCAVDIRRIRKTARSRRRGIIESLLSRTGRLLHRSLSGTRQSHAIVGFKIGPRTARQSRVPSPARLQYPG